jgi:ubiquinone/menaquinone biosynthesis C-methylase UbiE
MHDMPFGPNRFKLVFCAGALSCSYSARQVIDEIARVLKRPGYILVIDAAGRHKGPDALGRSDVVSIQTLIGLFYRYQYEVIAKDPGRSLVPERYENEPCLALRLSEGDHRSHDLLGHTDMSKFLSPH